MGFLWLSKNLFLVCLSVGVFLCVSCCLFLPVVFSLRPLGAPAALGWSSVWRFPAFLVAVSWFPAFFSAFFVFFSAARLGTPPSVSLLWLGWLLARLLAGLRFGGFRHFWLQFQGFGHFCLSFFSFSVSRCLAGPCVF